MEKLTLYKAVVISRCPVSERSEILRVIVEEGRSTGWLRGELSRRLVRHPVVVIPKREDLSSHPAIGYVLDPERYVSVSIIKSGVYTG